MINPTFTFVFIEQDQGNKTKLIAHKLYNILRDQNEKGEND